MALTCSICGHKKRHEIDSELLSGRPLRAIARQFGPTKDSLARHRAHLSSTVVKAHEAQEVARAGTLLADVRSGEDRAERLYAAAEKILNQALESDDKKTALNAIKAAVDIMGEARQYMELRGELTGELSKAAPNVTVNLIRTLMVPRPTEADICKAVPIVVDVKRLDG